MRSRALATLLCIMAVCATSLAHGADVRLWRELDIVPMPKQMELTGRELSLAGAAVVLGEGSSRQERIGAQWLSDECVAHGGEPIPAVMPGQGADAPLRIIVGTRRSNPLIAGAAEAGEVNVGLGNPGERGYVIVPREREGATELLLAGADDIGALYACITLGELFRDGDDGPTVREAAVRDWPDFIDMTLGAGYIGDIRGTDAEPLYNQVRWSEEPDQELRQAFLAAMREHYDRLLRWKVSSLWLNVRASTPPASRAVIREAVEYGKERGIGCLYYAMQPFAGRVADYPDYDGPKLPPGRYPEWIRCWSLDDMRRETADEFARLCAEIGYTDIGFHDTDTGGFLNPAQWEDRCEVCRERWGDDYAAATAQKYRIYYDALKQHIPEARMHIVIYPYSLRIYTQEGAEQYLEEKYGPGPGVPEAARRLRERYERFWGRVNEALPEDINVCIREERPQNLAAFRELIGDRPLYVYFKQLADPWTAFFSEAPRWTGTFFRDSRDFLFPPTLELYVPIQALAVREYAWNTEAPGAAPFARLPVKEQWRHCEPQGEIYDIVLPHVVRNFFGPRYAEQLAGALSRNVNPYEIFELKLFGGNPMFLTDYERWQWQADEATEGAALLDEVWTQRAGADDRLGMTGYAFRRFLYLREVFHCCRWMATARAHEMRARELARTGDLEGARAALAAGREAVERGKADVQQLLAERPDEPLYVRQDMIDRDRRLNFRLFTPDAGVDYDVTLRRIEQTEQELPALVAAAGIDQRILEKLSEDRVVHVGAAAGEITIDGRLDEPDWQRVYPSESFFVYRGGRKIADAPTQARLLHDDETIYVGFSCWLPGGGEPFAAEREHDAAVLQDDSVEVFLAPPEMEGGYVHLMVNAAGSLRDQLCRATVDDTGVTQIVRKPEWDAPGVRVAASQGEGRWDVEIALPLSDLGVEAVGGGWSANVTREYHSANQTQELSSILPEGCRDFHDRGSFRRVHFTGEEFSAPPLEVELAAAGFEAETQTLNDRIATVCRFGVEVHCSRALHDVTVSAEAWAPDGTLQRRKLLAQRPVILYEWAPEQTFEVDFAEQVDAGGVRLVLEAEEATAERWLRLGGWRGTAEAGAMLTDRGLTGRALADACVLPSRAVPDGGEEPVGLVESRTGTLELWIRPEWMGRELPLSSNFEMWRTRHCFLHFGPLRPEHPYLANHSSLAVEHGSPDWLRCAVTAPNYAGWFAQVDLNAIGGLAAGRWHHLAIVWDGEAPREDWLRVYIDGRRRSEGVRVSKEERFGDDPSLRVTTSRPYTIQVGCMTSGRCPADALIDELRISRVARYHVDFEPVRSEMSLDASTSLLMHFNEDLVGDGRAPDGAVYRLEAVPGVPEYH
ncbi:MAG: LamG-like jellyroll fold domain-containing protein [Armatimonadota bacterium]|nr:LamG-like jellyroll fold domain-containing protein [Armatimonadota bacterium]